MVVAELEVYHSRPIAPTRRVSLGKMRRCPPTRRPASAGSCSGASWPRTSAGIDPDLVPDLMRLTTELEEDRRVPQPRLRYRFQEDKVGLQRSRHRLIGHGEALHFEFDDDHGLPAQQVLGAVYAAGPRRPCGAPRGDGGGAAGRAVGGPVGDDLIAVLAGVGRGRPLSAVRASENPRSWALDVLGLPDRSTRRRTAGAPPGPGRGAEPVPRAAALGPSRPRRRRRRRRPADLRADRGPAHPARLMAPPPERPPGGRLLLAPGAGRRPRPTTRWWPWPRPWPRCRAARMDFPYRKAGRRAPDRAPVAVAAVRDEAAALVADARHRGPTGWCWGAGRSAGAWRRWRWPRASPAAGLVLLSYPLHPPGKPDRLRTEHFGALDVPCLFVSGEPRPVRVTRRVRPGRGRHPGPGHPGRGCPAGHDPKGQDEAIAAAVVVELARAEPGGVAVRPIVGSIGQVLIWMGVPSGSSPARRVMSALFMRMQPWLTWVPMSCGSLVPWRPSWPGPAVEAGQRVRVARQAVGVGPVGAVGVGGLDQLGQVVDAARAWACWTWPPRS